MRRKELLAEISYLKTKIGLQKSQMDFLKSEIKKRDEIIHRQRKDNIQEIGRRMAGYNVSTT